MIFPMVVQRFTRRCGLSSVAWLLLPLGLTLACQAQPERTVALPHQFPVTQPGDASPYRIVALLPLSGRLRAYGDEALKGIQLALARAKETPGSGSVEVVIK